MRIAHASIDENKHISGGQAGNQTGKEACIREWYNKPWTVVLRHPDRLVRERIATIAETLASPPYNSLIGYNQGQRNTFHTVAKKVGYNVLDFINAHELCETDCSAFVTCICLFAGIKQLEYSGNAPATSTMKSEFKRAGFNVLTDEKYVSHTDYLSKGDILLKPGSHTAIVLDDGRLYGKAKATEYYPACAPYFTSITEALKSIGVDSSKAFRRQIYSANFSDTYRYTARQNTSMLVLLKQGILIRP